MIMHSNAMVIMHDNAPPACYLTMPYAFVAPDQFTLNLKSLNLWYSLW